MVLKYYMLVVSRFPNTAFAAFSLVTLSGILHRVVHSLSKLLIKATNEVKANDIGYFVLPELFARRLFLQKQIIC